MILVCNDGSCSAIVLRNVSRRHGHLSVFVMFCVRLFVGHSCACASVHLLMVCFRNCVVDVFVGMTICVQDLCGNCRRTVTKHIYARTRI